MSNLAQAIIYKPQALSFEMQQFRQATVCWISGPYNTFRVQLSNNLPLEILRNQIILRPFLSKTAFFFFRTAFVRHAQKLHQKRSLLHISLKQWMVGNLVGFQNALRVRGVGYKFDISALKITIQAGYSHLLIKNLPLPQTFKSILLNRKLVKLYIQGADLAKLNLYLSALRNLRQPDVYKGKGIRYQKDLIIRKEGKKKKN